MALSRTGVEYMAITKAVKEANWLHGLLKDLGVSQKQLDVYSNNQSAIHLAKNQVFHSRTKHIDFRYHFVREILEEEILIQKIDTKEHPTRAKFEHCLDLVNILHILSWRLTMHIWKHRKDHFIICLFENICIW